MQCPLITIAIPTLNQARFLEQALDSLLSQNYPRLQLIVLDGGSTDGTRAILDRYQHHFYFWRSASDDGPWASIQEALTYVETGWFNWLNSDDFLLPGSLGLIARLIERFPDHEWITGARMDVDAQGLPMRAICPWLSDPRQIAFGEPFLPQDATFFHVPFIRELAPKVPLDFRLTFDTILYRLAWNRKPPLLTNAVFSAMRWHGDQLTSPVNQHKRDDEYVRARSVLGENPIGGARRLLRRACRTRYSAEFSAVTEALLTRGYFGSRELQACLYWPWHLEMKACSVSEAYALYRY